MKAEKEIIWDPEWLAARSRADSTWRAYASDWAHFTAWCAKRRLSALPASPETVGAYLADHGRTLKISTLERRISAILVHHRQAGLPLDRAAPRIADVLAGLRRTLGTAPTRKAAVTPDALRGMVAALPESLAGVRDRAILLVGFFGAFRRSELGNCSGG